MHQTKKEVLTIGEEGAKILVAQDFGTAIISDLTMYNVLEQNQIRLLL